MHMYTVIGEMSDSCPDPGVVTANISLGGNINSVHSVCVDTFSCWAAELLGAGRGGDRGHWSPAILKFLPWPTGWWLAREAQKTALHVYLLQFLEGILCTQKLFIFYYFWGYL